MGEEEVDGLLRPLQQGIFAAQNQSVSQWGMGR